LCNICDEANAPLDLVNKIVGVICDAPSNGLNMESNIICSWERFLKHLNNCFNAPIPETVYAKTKDQQGNEQIVAIIQHNFLSQAIDLIHSHEIWGD